MIERTLQEWANFIGCYVAMDEDKTAWMYLEEPTKDVYSWVGDSIHRIPLMLLEDTTLLDWEVLYTPEVEELPLEKGDKLFGWQDIDNKDTIPSIVYFDSIGTTPTYVTSSESSNIPKTYTNYKRFNKELAGLTIAELEAL